MPQFQISALFLANYHRLYYSSVGGGHLHVQQHEGEPDGVPGQVCPEREGGAGGGHQTVLRGKMFCHQLGPFLSVTSVHGPNIYKDTKPYMS
jgi:hypothetical protein